MDGRNFRTRTRSKTPKEGTAVLPVSRIVLNYLQDADRVKLTVKHPNKDTVRKLVLKLANLESTAREDDSAELTVKVGLPETNGWMETPRNIVFQSGNQTVRFSVEDSRHDGFPNRVPMTEGLAMAN